MFSSPCPTNIDVFLTKLSFQCVPSPERFLSHQPPTAQRDDPFPGVAPNQPLDMGHEPASQLPSSSILSIHTQNDVIPLDSDVPANLDPTFCLVRKLPYICAFVFSTGTRRDMGFSLQQKLPSARMHTPISLSQNQVIWVLVSWLSRSPNTPTRVNSLAIQENGLPDPGDLVFL